MTEATNKWAKKLSKLKGVITDRAMDIHANVIRTGSPSIDFCFGNSWGLPLGFTLALFGPPKGGKSLIAYAMTANVHKTWPDGQVVKFDTEYRDIGQLTQLKARQYGIDLGRYTAIQINTADGVFDQIENELAAMCEDGFPLKLVIIDSINGIMGNRMQNAESVTNVQIGDQAQTLQNGFKRILAVQRKYGFAMLLTAQVRAEMDQAEIRRGNTMKMGASYGVQHYAEYFAMVERLKTVAGRTDLFDKTFEDKGKTDITGKADATAHRIRFTMKDSSLGPAGRKGIMTFSYEHGLINQAQELFELGDVRGILEPNGNNTFFSFNEKKLSKKGWVEAFEAEPDLSTAMVAALMAQENSPTAAVLPGINVEGEVAGPDEA